MESIARALALLCGEFGLWDCCGLTGAHYTRVRECVQLDVLATQRMLLNQTSRVGGSQSILVVALGAPSWVAATLAARSKGGKLKIGDSCAVLRSR